MAESSVHILKISPFLVSREAACNHHNHQLLINDSRFVYVALLLTGSLWKASLWKPLLLVKVSKKKNKDFVWKNTSFACSGGCLRSHFRWEREVFTGLDRGFARPLRPPGMQMALSPAPRFSAPQQEKGS